MIQELIIIFVADITIRILAQTGKPFAPVGYDNLLNTTTTMVKFEVYDIADAVTGS